MPSEGEFARVPILKKDPDESYYETVAGIYDWNARFARATTLKEDPNEFFDQTQQDYKRTYSGFINVKTKLMGKNRSTIKSLEEIARILTETGFCESLEEARILAPQLPNIVFPNIVKPSEFKGREKFNRMFFDELVNGKGEKIYSVSVREQPYGLP